MLEITWHLCKWQRQQQQTILQLHFTKHHRCNVCVCVLHSCLHIWKKSQSLRSHIRCWHARTPHSPRTLYPQMTLQLMMIFFFFFSNILRAFNFHFGFPYYVFRSYYCSQLLLLLVLALLFICVVRRIGIIENCTVTRQPCAVRKNSVILC